MDIGELADEAKEVVRQAMKAAMEIAGNEESTPKEKLDALKAGVAAATAILDRTDPKLTSTREIHMDVTKLVQQLSKTLPPGQAQAMLENLEDKMLPGGKSAAGRPKAIEVEVTSVG